MKIEKEIISILSNPALNEFEKIDELQNLGYDLEEIVEFALSMNEQTALVG